MDPFTIGSIAAPIVGGLIGQQASAGARSNAENDAKAALAALQGVSLPDIEKMRLALEDQQVVGNLAPTLEQQQLMGPTAQNNIAVNPKYNEYTMSALQKMADVQQNGLPEADRAQLQALLGQASQQNASQQKAILENRAARGMGGSGDELAAQLAASQGGANQASQQAMQLAALAAQRKLDATSGLANLANTAGNTDYSRQANLANATDVINQFNTSNAQNVGQRNVSAQNAAQQANLANKQTIANQNVDTHNKQQQYNKNLYQQDFQNQATKASGVAQGFNNMSQTNQNAANATAGMWSGIGSGIGSGAAYMGAAKKPAAAGQS
jgi:hypothetical protein